MTQYESLTNENPTQVYERFCELSREHEGYVLIQIKNITTNEDTLINPRRMQLEKDGVTRGNNGNKFLDWIQENEYEIGDVFVVTPDINLPEPIRQFKSVQGYVESLGYSKDDAHFVGKWVKPLNMAKHIETLDAEKEKYEKALDNLGLKIHQLGEDQNIIHITGPTESYKAIFKDLVESLGTKKTEAELEADWEKVLLGSHLRPGGTYMVTTREVESHPTLEVMVVNDRDDKKIVGDMNEAIKQSILNAANRH